MAVDPLDIPITRDDVQGWLNIYQNLPKSKQQPLKDFLLARIAAKGMTDTNVNTVGHDNLRDATPLVDMIIADLPSYGYSG